MKTRTLSVSAVLCMALVGTTVYAVTPPGGFGTSKSSSSSASSSSSGDERSSSQTSPSSQVGSTTSANPSQFNIGTTVAVDGRLGHSALQAKAPGETFVLLELRGAS